MTEAGSVYGQALYSLAHEEALDADILSELEQLGAVFSETPDFLRLLAAPNLPKQERCAVIDNCLRGRVHPYVLNFLKVLTEKGCALRFPACVRAYREQYNQDHGILSVRAVSAVPLSDAQMERLRQKLSAVTGKSVVLENSVEPACLGGVRLDYDGKRIDGTVSHRLDAIRDRLKNTVL